MNKHDWRDKLSEWLGAENPKTAPENLQQLHQAFVSRFPLGSIDTITIEDFAAGTGSRDTFCYWLEKKTADLGRIGGGRAGAKQLFGLFWSTKRQSYEFEQRFSNANDAFEFIRKGINDLLSAAESERFQDLDSPENPLHSKRLMRGKILYLYFPQFFLPVYNQEHIRFFIKLFGQDPVDGDLIALNRQLSQCMQGQPEFSGFDNLQMMRFLYDSYGEQVKAKMSHPGQVHTEEISPGDEPTGTVRNMLSVAKQTRNIILYGPPGTGKTYNARMFPREFLKNQLNRPATPVQRKTEVLSGLKWYEAVALAMELRKDHKLFKVADLANDELISDYYKTKASQKLTNTLWAQLQIHTDPDIQTVKYVNRSEPYLFAKNKSSEWSLTEEGHKYVNDTLSAELKALQNDQPRALRVEDFCEWVTFHQSFSYEDFVEGIRPVIDEENDQRVTYTIRKGILRRICDRALADHENNYVLIIDEINRTNISKVLGELITLIEDDKRINNKRDGIKVSLPYSGESFGVPDNLYIIGTMNTADRSIALLDIALRRRFAFIEVLPEPELLKEVHGVDLRSLLETLNQNIAANLDNDHRIGHSYLINVQSIEDLEFAWNCRIIPLLQEYFHNDGERLQSVLGDQFITDVKNESIGLGMAQCYQIQRLYGDELLDTLKAFCKNKMK